MMIKCLICGSHLMINTKSHLKMHEDSIKHKTAINYINEDIEEYNIFLKKNSKSKIYNEMKKNLEYNLIQKYIE